MGMKQLPDVYVVRTHFDVESGYWTASSDDIPGLVTEAADYEELRQNVCDLTPDLLMMNVPEENRDQVIVVFESIHAMNVSMQMAAE